MWGPVNEILQECLHKAPYMKEEIEEILHEKLEKIMAKSPTSLAVLAAATNFKLYQVDSQCRFWIACCVSDRRCYVETKW